MAKICGDLMKSPQNRSEKKSDILPIDKKLMCLPEKKHSVCFSQDV